MTVGETQVNWGSLRVARPMREVWRRICARPCSDPLMLSAYELISRGWGQQKARLHSLLPAHGSMIEAQAIPTARFDRNMSPLLVILILRIPSCLAR
jgi:hypothetical protein